MSKSVFDYSNTCVVGLTRHGKSYFVKQKLKESKNAVLYINPQNDKSRLGFTVADKRNKLSQIVGLLKAGKKVEYRMDGVTEESVGELVYIVEGMMKAGFNRTNSVDFAIDEIHFFSGYRVAAKCLESLACAGITRGLNNVFISQRFANMPYTIITQSSQLYLFKQNMMDGSYMKGKGFPFAEIEKRITEKGKYSYVIWDSEKGLLGAFKE